MRSDLGSLGLGDISLQEFGEPEEVLIRVQRQEGDEDAQPKPLKPSKTCFKTALNIAGLNFVGAKSL